MTIHILTLFPKLFEEVFSTSIIYRAQEKKLVNIKIHNLRKWAEDKHQTVDDTPYGGGAGMILKVNVVDRAIATLKSKIKNAKLKIILLTPKGEIYTQKKALALSKFSDIIIICGHYGGFDERIFKLVDEKISIGNYVLTGGEIPAMVLVDSITRLVPNVINPNSLKDESFSKIIANQEYKTYLQFPQYTRPEIYRPQSIKIKKSLRVPKVLISGNHAKILKWRNGKTKTRQT